MKRTNDVHPVDEILPAGRLGLLGLQHVLVMYAGAVAVPLVVGGALKLPKEQMAMLINADLFACGMATIVQSVGIWRFGIRMPVMMGVTFTAVSPMVAMATTPGIGLLGIYGAVIAAGVFGIVAAPVISRMLPLFPPVVTGSIITTVGISLMRVAVNWAAGGNPTIRNPADLAGPMMANPAYGAPLHLGVARHRSRLHPPGHEVREGLPRKHLGSRRSHRRHGGRDRAWQGGLRPASRSAPWFAAVYPFSVRHAHVRPGGVPDHVPGHGRRHDRIAWNVPGRRTHRRHARRSDAPLGRPASGRARHLDWRRLQYPSPTPRSPRTSGSSASPECEAAGSRRSAASSSSRSASCRSSPSSWPSIPPFVLGGAGLVMFGMVCATGIRILGGRRLRQKTASNLYVVALSLGFGMIPLIAETFFDQMPKALSPLLHSGILLASIVAIALNAFFNLLTSSVDAVCRGGRRRREDPGVVTASPAAFRAIVLRMGFPATPVV